jgi:hypothetical protein
MNDDEQSALISRKGKTMSRICTGLKRFNLVEEWRDISKKLDRMSLRELNTSTGDQMMDRIRQIKQQLEN